MQLKYAVIVALLITALIAVAVPAEAASQYPMTVTDSFGRNITLDHAPQRIVSLSSADTEILFALGAGNRIVGNTMYDDYPPEAVNITHVGGFSDQLSALNKESIVNLTPDLIIAEDTISEKAVNQLTEMGYPVLMTVNHNISMIEKNIRLLGRVTDTENNATAIMNDMETAFDSIRAKVANLSDSQKPTVLFMAGYVRDGEVYVYGADTFGDELIRMAGGKNIVTKPGYPVISSETIIQADPDCVIIPVDAAGAMGSEDDFNYFKSGGDSRFSDLSAVKNGNVFKASTLVMHPGPRLPQAAVEIEKIIEQMNTEQTNVQPSSTTPGFEMFFALAGLIGAACIFAGRKH